MGIILCETLLSFKLILYQAEKKKIAWLVCFLFFVKPAGYCTVQYRISYPCFYYVILESFPCPFKINSSVASHERHSSVTETPYSRFSGPQDML